jgi:twitching motility protein PilT
MTRLNDLFEYLFANEGSRLVLDSGTPGTFEQPGSPPFPVFRAPLMSGQILLLFTDVIPKELSARFLGGEPIEFQHQTVDGTIALSMKLTGDDLHIEANTVATSAGEGQPNAVSRETSFGLRALLAEMELRNATRLHLSAGAIPLMRVDGHMIAVPGLTFSESALNLELEALAPPPLRSAMSSLARFDFSFVEGEQVFHLTAQRSHHGVQLVARRIPKEVPSFAALGLPLELLQSMGGHGLWILSSPPGQGLTTTLASTVQALTTQRQLSVRTIETPIEYVLSPGMGTIAQLEVGAHCETALEGLTDAVRDDLDIVAVSDFDDPAMLSAALTLCERGKLVIGGVRAKGAVSAAEKLLALTPTSWSRWQLAQHFKGLFNQALVRSPTGASALAWELLPGVLSVRNALLAGETSALSPLRTRTMEQSLAAIAQPAQTAPHQEGDGLDQVA